MQDVIHMKHKKKFFMILFYIFSYVYVTNCQVGRWLPKKNNEKKIYTRKKNSKHKCCHKMAENAQAISFSLYD